MSLSTFNYFVLVRIQPQPEPRIYPRFPPNPELDISRHPQLSPLSPPLSPQLSPRQLFPSRQNQNFRIIGVFSSEERAYVHLNRFNQRFIHMYRVYGPFRLDSVFDHYGNQNQTEF